ncbi:MAG TPA: GNAT family N-acetyltransferase [Rhodospirillaceae bacterium]|nr:GNAT family N-acetyltransferase [Rhodospirillaceae bacterium]
MTRIALRPYHRWDAPILARLFLRAVWGGAKRRYSRRQRHAWAPRLPALSDWRKRLEGQTILVAARHHRAVGFMTLRNDGVLDLAFVDPAFTGRGIGGLLLRKIIETAKVRGLERLHTDASLVAYPLFRRHGWTVVRRRTVRRRGVNLINLRMELTL